MTTKTKPTQKRDPGKAPAVANRGNPDDPWWYLSRGSMVFRETADRDPDDRADLYAMSLILSQLQSDPDFRAKVIRLARQHEGAPANKTTAFGSRQAREFVDRIREAVQLYTVQGPKGPKVEARNVAFETLVNLSAYTLLYGNKPPPRLAAVLDAVADRIEPLVDDLDDIDPEKIAKAVLRVVGVRERFLQQLYE